MKIVLALCLFFALSQARSFRGDKVFRITINSETQLTRLQNLADQYELDFWKEPRALGENADIRVPLVHLNQFLVHLTTSRLNYEVFIEDVQELIDQQTTPHPSPRDLGSFDYNVYHPYEEIVQWVDDFTTAYPSLVTKSSLGASYEGRDMLAVTVSTATGNPQFVINCGIHAREWVTPATCMYSAKFLVEGYGSDSTVTQLMNNVDFVFIPSSNPDGYAYTWSNDRMWRKTRSPTSVNRCVGVDPNRNWDANHCGAGSSTSPCSDTYCGPTPFSEKCTENQKNFVESLPNPKVYADIHAYSQMWMFPYGYTYSLCADHDILTEIAKDSVDAIRSRHGMIYEDGPISTVIYQASGSTADYYYDVSNIKCSFATELRDTGRYGFLLPENQILPTAEETFEAFKVMAQAIIDGKC